MPSCLALPSSDLLQSANAKTNSSMLLTLPLMSVGNCLHKARYLQAIKALQFGFQCCGSGGFLWWSFPGVCYPCSSICSRKQLLNLPLQRFLQLSDSLMVFQALVLLPHAVTLLKLLIESQVRFWMVISKAEPECCRGHHLGVSRRCNSSSQP